MIYVLTSDELFNRKLRKKLTALGLQFQFVDFTNLRTLDFIYQNNENVEAVIADTNYPKLLHEKAWVDLLEGLGKRIPVLVVSAEDKTTVPNHEGHGTLLTWLRNPSMDDIAAFLKTCGIVNSARRVLNQTIPIYNPMLPAHIIQMNGFISVMTIDTSPFRKIAIEYGSEVYAKLQTCFQRILLDLWGMEGSFRSSDIVCRLNQDSNIFIVLLEEARTGQHVPLPGDLERIADRINAQLENKLWSELFKPQAESLLPSALEIIPSFFVGYGTALHNPCVSNSEIVEGLLDSCREKAKTQQRRKLGRQSELMQVLIQSETFLVPHYQAVFNLQTIEVAEARKAAADKSIKDLSKHLYAFESLIRVNKDAMGAYFVNKDMLIEIKYLRPDVIFAIAHDVDLTLELDQACFRHAVTGFRDLPGRLMANILPRNFYHIDLMKHLIPEGTKITFEVSESEAINNLRLLQQARDSLGAKNFGIAIDDFGKGYSGLGRIINIKPDIIKFDRSLIQDIHKDASKRAFVEGLVDAAKNIQLTILAEGVEVIEEMVVLKELGIDLIQGFLLHRPQSAETILKDLGLDKGKKLDTVA